MTVTATPPTGFDIRWATGGSASVTEPSSGEKDAGWIAAEEPPAETFNWLEKGVYLWKEYLAAAVAELDAGTLPLTGGTLTGDLTTSGNVTAAAVIADAAAIGALGVSGDSSLSGDLTVGGHFSVTGSMNTTLLPTADATINVGSSSKRIAALYALQLRTDSVVMDAGPGSGVPLTNTLVSRMIPKAWGSISTDGSGGVTLAAGGNVNSSVTLAGSTGSKVIQVTFAGAMANTNYAVMLNGMSANVHPVCNGKTTGQVTIAGYAFGTNTVQGFDTHATVVDFVVFGEQ